MANPSSDRSSSSSARRRSIGENVSVTPESITFILDEDRQKKSLTIRNDGPKPLMIKMKSTLPGALKMRPVYGRVDAKATTTIQLELRWNSAAKRIPADSTKDRVTVVLAEVPNLPKPPPIFWMEFKKQDKATKTITKKVQLKFEPSSSEKPQKPPGDASASEKPNKASTEKADTTPAKADKPKPATIDPTPPHTTNVEVIPEASTPRAVLIAEKEKAGQDKSTDKSGDLSQMKSEPGLEKTKEASSEEPRDKGQTTTTGEKQPGAPVEKAAVITPKDTSDSSSSSSSSSEEEKK